VNCNMITPLGGQGWIFFALPFSYLAPSGRKEKAPQLVFHMLCSAWMFDISDLNSVWFCWACFLLDWESVTNQCWLASQQAQAISV